MISSRDLISKSHMRPSPTIVFLVPVLYGLAIDRTQSGLLPYDMYPLCIHFNTRQKILPKPLGVQACYATLCATQLYKHGKNQKRNERGYDKESTLRYKKNKSQKYLPLRTPTKIPSKNNAATPSLTCFSPRPHVHLFIVVLFRLSTGRCG